MKQPGQLPVRAREVQIQTTAGAHQHGHRAHQVPDDVAEAAAPRLLGQHAVLDGPHQQLGDQGALVVRLVRPEPHAAGMVQVHLPQRALERVLLRSVRNSVYIPFSQVTPEGVKISRLVQFYHFLRLCHPSLGRVESIAEVNGELPLGRLPVQHRSSPLGTGLAQRQIDQLLGRPHAGEVSSSPHRPAHRGVQALDGVRGVDRLADQLRERQERDHQMPPVAPGAHHVRMPASQLALLERVQQLLGPLRALRLVDGLERVRQLPALLVRRARQRMAHQVHDAGLHRGLRKRRLQGLGKALQSIHHRDQNVPQSPRLELVQHVEPELGPLVLAQPQAENVLVAPFVHADRQIRRPSGHRSGVPHLDVDRVQIHDRVRVPKRPALPLRVLLHHHVGHPRDQIGRHLDAVQLTHRLPDPTRRHAPGEQMDHLVVEVSMST